MIREITGSMVSRLLECEFSMKREPPEESRPDIALDFFPPSESPDVFRRCEDETRERERELP